MITVDKQIKDDMKTQRLLQLKRQYFDFDMNKVAYLAQGKTENANEMQKLMDEVETSYNAILAM